MTEERSADRTVPTSGTWRRDTTARYGRCGALAVLVAAATILFAACGGGSDSPQIASLGASTTLGASSSSAGGGKTSSAAGGGKASSAAGGEDASSATSDPKASPATSSPNGNATALLDEWTTCIRSHGDPNQVDPTIDANKDIEITMENVSETLENEVHGSTGPCSNYLVAAANVLRAGQPAPTAPDAAQLAKYVDCMRTNGVPNYPDFSANGKTNFNSAGVDPNSPIFQKADKVCSKKTGLPYYAPGTEAPGVVKVTGCNGACPNGGRPPGGKGGANQVPSGRVPSGSVPSSNG